MVGEWVIGAALGIGFVGVARLFGGGRELAVLAFGLVVAALAYPAFALAGADRFLLLLDVSGVVVFGALAWLALRMAPLLLALGWGLHVMWDVGLHDLLAPGGIPPWYPGVCAGFDLALAGYILWAYRGVSAAPGEPGPRASDGRSAGT